MKETQGIFHLHSDREPKMFPNTFIFSCFPPLDTPVIGDLGMPCLITCDHLIVL